MKKLFFLTFLIVLLVTTNLFANTYKSGMIINETWTKADSPYCIDGDITVSILTIEPGVRIEFMESEGAPYVFEVAGLLTAIGTKEEPITFTIEENNTKGWSGIYFHESSQISELKHCIIEKSINSGIRIDDSLVTIHSCTISDNKASQGGGIYIFLSTLPASELILKDCVFTGNTSSSHGGALRVFMEEGHKLIIEECLFESNTANPSHATGNYVGGALYIAQGDVAISNTQFKGNRSNSQCTGIVTCSVTARGGAIFIGGTSNVTIECSRILENWAHAWNTGICAHGGSTNSYGGSVYVNSGTVTLKNNIIADNSTTGTNACGPSFGGSGLYVNGGSVTVVNNTIVYNSNTGVHRAGGVLDIMNSILYFNNAEGTQVGGTPTITYSDVQGCYPGEGNICKHPILGEYDEVVIGSPCIDTGNPDSQYNDERFPPSLGTERNDMGAHGGPSACGVPPCNEIDLNLPAGWSMISLPVVPESPALSDVFPGAVVVYGYERNVGYVRVQEDQALEVGKGYWILLNEVQTYALTGECIQEYPLSVEDGWYMIGGCTDPAQVFPHDCEIGAIYGYAQGTGYKRVPASEPLEPGQGYWILLNNVTGEGTISVETVY